MQKKLKIKLLYVIAIPISLIILLISFLTIFEYTAVANIRESLSGVDKQETLAYGKMLFETRGCSTCHAIQPNVESLGPNLSGLAQRAKEEYVRQSIISPRAVIVSGYADVVMPDFGDILDSSQVDALVAYVLQIE